MSTSKLNSMTTLIKVIILWQLFTTSQFPFDYVAPSYNADGAKQEEGVSTKGLEQLKYSSSKVNEVIRTISDWLIFLSVKKAPKRETNKLPPRRSLYAQKIVVFFVFCLLVFVLLVGFCLIYVFACSNVFCKKKKKKKSIDLNLS